MTVPIAPARVLVVDDEPVIREFIQEVLSDRGFEVVTVEGASAALAQIEASSWQVVVTDLKMPGMSGLDLYRVLSARWPALAERVVMMTGDLSGEERSMWTGAERQLLNKPFAIVELTDAVERVLRLPTRLTRSEVDA